MSQILTKDSVTVFVTAIMYYKVKDPASAVANVDDYSGSSRLLAATTLRDFWEQKHLEIFFLRENLLPQKCKTCFMKPQSRGV